MRALFLFLLALSLAGCGGVTIRSYTNIYIFGDGNRITESLRTDSRPDIKPTTSTTVDATIPVVP